ncbi:MAG: ATP-binding protein [Chloroflexota bacterium]
MFHSIRWRIALPYVILILVTMLGVGFYITYFARQTYLSALESELSAEAVLASETVGPFMEPVPDPVTLDALARRWSTRLGTRVTIIAADGVVLGESHEDRTQMENHLNRPEIQQALREGKGAATRYSVTLGKFLRYLAIPVYANEEVIGFVRMALPVETVNQTVASLQSALAAATFVITIFAVLLALWIAGRSMLPLVELTQAVGQIAEGDLALARLDKSRLKTTSDEIGDLTRAFDSMTLRLQEQIQALETERSKMAAVLGVMSDGVLIVDREGRIQLINAAAESMFNVQAQNTTNRSVAEVLRHHQLVELWQRCQALGDSQVATVELSKQKLYLQGIATPLGKALPGSTLLLFQNLTRLRRLETIRQDFISNISHELRTPLASLKALTETLQESALEDPPAARRFLQRMETEVDSLSLMVSELLELARIESGRVPLKLEPVAPFELLELAVERLRLQAERAGLQVEIDCPDDLPEVLADPSRLEQVLVNLLHNAIKFTPKAGMIYASASIQNENILFSVQDTGIGISADDLPRIFERFYKTDRARSSGGTGLGLAIARHLVEAHGGRIWAESREGQGSSFYFTVPITH